MKYSILHEDGTVLECRTAPDEHFPLEVQAHPPGRVVGGHPPFAGRWKYAAGEFVALPDVAPSTAQRRNRDMPPVSEQLDALWHAMDQGVLPMVPAFYDPIKAVKDAHPKQADK